jgi:sulfur relay (sulfurtransferase) DsrF/TusC family protein
MNVPKKPVVIIGSHISKIKRIHFFTECIFSLIKQTNPVDIYISASFETPTLEEVFETAILQSNMVETFRSFHILQCYIHQEKTPQMRHIEYICSQLRQQNPAPEWVLFCDDDDTFEEHRVEKFMHRIADCEEELAANSIDLHRFVGVYEQHDFGENHRQTRHEYWCYCIRLTLLTEFIDKLQPWQDVLENKCCDIVLGEFLRRRNETDLFSCLTDTKLYNYRRHDNEDSVTGTITSKKDIKLRKAEPPSMDDIRIVDYIIEFHKYLEENIYIYIHDTFLRTVAGNKFDEILQFEFMADCPLLEYVDESHVAKMRSLYDRLRTMCDAVYDEKLPNE